MARLRPALFVFAAACAALPANAAAPQAPPAAKPPAEPTLQELMDHGDYARAEPRVKKALAGLHAAEGHICRQTDRLPEAVAELELAAKLDPENDGIQKQLASLRKELAAEKGRRREAGEHFTLLYEGEIRADWAAGLCQVLEEVRRDVGQRFQLWPKEKTTVVLHTDGQYLYDLSQPDWSSAVYDGKIHLRGTDILDRRDKLAGVLAHEYAHGLISRIFGPRIPSWFNEGLAQNARPGAEPPADAARRWNAVGKKTLPAPWELEAGFTAAATRQQAQAAYLETLFFMRWMLERYDITTVTRWGKALAEGKTVGETTAAVFAMSPDQLLAAWKESMAEK